MRILRNIVLVGTMVVFLVAILLAYLEDVPVIVVDSYHHVK